jgi:hypothetical protein
MKLSIDHYGKFMPKSKPKSRNSTSSKKFSRATLIKILVLLAIVPLVAAAVFLIRYYYIFDGTIEAKLGRRIRLTETRIYAAPTLLYPGKKISFEELEARFRRLGYQEEKAGPDACSYRVVSPSHLMIHNDASPSIRMARWRWSAPEKAFSR